MGCLGVHFAVTDEQRAGLEAAADDDARIRYLQEVVEEGWDEENLVETDKAWDGIHRCLGEFPPDTPYFYPVDPKHGGWALPEDHGTPPLKLCVLGGRRLMEEENRYFIRLIEPDEVVAVSAAIDAIDEDEMRTRYFRYCKGAWPEYGEEDFGYCWAYFEELREFFRRVAGSGRTVVFSADQ